MERTKEASRRMLILPNSSRIVDDQKYNPVISHHASQLDHLIEADTSDHKRHLRFIRSPDGNGLTLEYNGHSSQRIHNASYYNQIDVAWPPLKSLIADANASVVGDVQFLLDFAIIAHPKTATSSMLHWFRSHPEIQMHDQENHALASGKPAELVADLYHLETGHMYKRGYKAPRDLIVREALLSLANHWPKTKLIVGIRHPVLWFESFYNFRVHNGYKMPPPETLIGPLQQGMVGVATDEAKFHLHLDNLGKTSHSTDELRLLSWGVDKPPKLPKLSNPVFLYEISQMSDANETRSSSFCSDLANYLGLQTAFNPISSKRGPTYPKAIEICEPRYRAVRHELMKHAIESSTWIQKYFLRSPDVVVSSPEFFHQLMISWIVDPCEA